ncbi:cardiolipin synthase [Bacillaceae bacterium S4-13-56]
MEWITTYGFGIMMFINILFGIALIFLERRDASVTWAWLMVLMFIPVIGFMVYLLFGRRLNRKHIFKWDQFDQLGVQEQVQSQLSSLRNETFSFVNKASEKNKDLIYMFLQNDEAVLTQNNDVQIFLDGKEKFSSLMEDLKKAKDHIHIVYYIIRDDFIGQKIGEILAQKAREGVEVRVLYDALGSKSLKKSSIRQLQKAGVEMEAFFPSKFAMINPRINFRNHRKLVIVDGIIGYTGGFNIGDEYLGMSKKFGYWRDSHLRIEGDAVQSIQTRFLLDWNQASRRHIVNRSRYYPPISAEGNVGIQVVTSGPDSDWEQIKNGYLKVIMSAKKYVYIQTPYFIPDASVLDALRVASLSGVDVRIMIPKMPDHPFVYWATYSYVGELLNAGVKIFIYQKGFMHAKTIVADDVVSSVGTANIDVRSFRLNFEVNAFLYDEEITLKLVNGYREDMNHSSELTMEIYNNRSHWIRFKESIARLLTPIL